MKWLKKWYWIFGIALIVCFIIYLFPWRHKIDTTIQGIQCRIGDEDYSEYMSIKIKGVCKQYLIKNDAFEGTISIDSYDFTLDSPIIPTSFYDGHASLIYQNIQESIDNKGSFGFIICAPAKNHMQALEIAKILSSKSKWLSNTNWN